MISFSKGIYHTTESMNSFSEKINPLVSIIINCYNGEKMKNCIDSVINQT